MATSTSSAWLRPSPGLRVDEEQTSYDAVGEGFAVGRQEFSNPLEPLVLRQTLTVFACLNPRMIDGFTRISLHLTMKVRMRCRVVGPVLLRAVGDGSAMLGPKPLQELQRLGDVLSCSVHRSSGRFPCE